jgi:hypothetical protein
MQLRKKVVDLDSLMSDERANNKEQEKRRK